MSSEARSTVGLTDLARRLPAMIPELPTMVRGLRGLTRSPDAKESLGLVFQNTAASHPRRTFLRFEGRSLSYRSANVRVNRYAHALADLGVARGDVVGLLSKNTPETLLITLALAKLGAAAGMLNHNQRGTVLAHSLALLNSRLLVLAEDCREAADSVEDRRVVPTLLYLDELDRLAESAGQGNPSVCEQIRARETAFYIFTSGTTGLPKASVMSHFRWLESMSGLGSMGVRLRSSDTLFCCLPLYHNNALTVSLSSVLASGATFALGRQFSVSRFWSESALNKATAFAYIGELCRYLLNQPATPRDRDNSIRLIVGNGLRPEIWSEFTGRFGISRVVEFYGASECNIAFVNALGIDRTAGICPLPHAVVDYDEENATPRRYSDGRLRKVETGAIGLLLSKVTDRAPFDGYSDEQDTQKKLVRDAFEDGDCWFDTGDLVRRQGWWHIAFVDRLGDTFRWKGENVATTEVESALNAYPSIALSVVYGVMIPGTDGRAGMATVTLHQGEEFDGSVIAEFLFRRLPGYAVPLFVRVVERLEQTSTFKSRKVELRKAGYEVGEDGSLYVLLGRREGYRSFYEGYPGEVARGVLPRA